MRRIPALGVLSLALLLLLLLPTTAAAQADSTPRPLGIPSAEMRCRILPLAAEDSARGAAVQMEFEIGDVRSAEERSLRVAWDRAGRPVSLIAMVTFASPERGIVFHGISARFGRGGDAVGVHARHSQGIADAARPESAAGGAMTKTLQSLTAEEQREARALAAWLWTKRCG